MRFNWTIILSIFLAGCATTVVYNPMQVATQEELLLNQNEFKAIQDGMTTDQVHNIMGTSLVIGYQYQNPNYKPLTIPNPYKSETIKGTDYFVEYYVQSIQKPDGNVSDGELMPLIFKDGKLFGRGWPVVKSLSPFKPS